MGCSLMAALVPVKPVSAPAARGLALGVVVRVLAAAVEVGVPEAVDLAPAVAAAQASVQVATDQAPAGSVSVQLPRHWNRGGLKNNVGM